MFFIFFIIGWNQKEIKWFVIRYCIVFYVYFSEEQGFIEELGFYLHVLFIITNDRQQFKIGYFIWKNEK